jgi:ABC-type antimicrobial peptide transport system permease subunit
MLENSILQGGLIVSEDNFLTLFKKAAGYRMFMLRSKSGTGHQPQVEQSIAKLRERYSDLGLIIEPARERLAKFQQVQNTYISTFQTLGALGLLLGTMGLAAVQIRSLLERQKELGLMRSVGFSWRQISRLVLMENLLLLVFGLGGGLLAALVTTLPHYIIGGASIPWIDLAVLFGVILIFGLAAAILGTRMVYRIPIVESLRTE